MGLVEDRDLDPDDVDERVVEVPADDVRDNTLDVDAGVLVLDEGLVLFCAGARGGPYGPVRCFLQKKHFLLQQHGTKALRHIHAGRLDSSVPSYPSNSHALSINAFPNQPSRETNP